ncbi:serine/threonine-protein kinase [Sansalvadorimonas verongulae]|uniref:serine/threonine-protein kinase n=1 Tax=Sansalvadorimonas verongulae TaxID=2172824 RepID=UPI0012BB9078|nr:serine/threonine-protein kinase [Sansalvadorimonas verongulae]MTI14739.1 serine/threonine-protein kinase [Sansalvadorimonas verongulae]
MIHNNPQSPQSPQQPPEKPSEESGSKASLGKRIAIAYHFIKKKLGGTAPSDFVQLKSGTVIDKRNIRHITQPTTSQEAERLRHETIPESQRSPQANKWTDRWKKIKAVLQGKRLPEPSAQVINKELRPFRTLGEGSFGKVDSFVEGYAGKLKVRKVLKAPDTGAPNTEAREALAKELWIQKSLRHPNLVSITPISRQASLDPLQQTEIFMEDGGVPLSRIIKAPENKRTPANPTPQEARYGGKLPLPLQQEACTQVLKGLAYLKSANVIHRDIKPANILINPGRLGPEKDTEGREQGAVKIADFGFAEHLPDNQSTVLKGTPAYAAPELMETALNGGKTSYGIEVDMFSAGCVFFEMITGKKYMDTTGVRDLNRYFQHYKEWTKSDRAKEHMERELKAALLSQPPEYTHLAVDFLSRMLDVNPQTRMTPDEALHHPFLAYVPPRE